jgi:hypothetical protein
MSTSSTTALVSDITDFVDEQVLLSGLIMISGWCINRNLNTLVTGGIIHHHQVMVYLRIVGIVWLLFVMECKRPYSVISVTARNFGRRRHIFVTARQFSSYVYQFGSTYQEAEQTNHPSFKCWVSSLIRYIQPSQWVHICPTNYFEQSRRNLHLKSSMVHDCASWRSKERSSLMSRHCRISTFRVVDRNCILMGTIISSVPGLAKNATS